MSEELAVSPIPHGLDLGFLVGQRWLFATPIGLGAMTRLTDLCILWFFLIYSWALV